MAEAFLLENAIMKIVIPSIGRSHDVRCAQALIYAGLEPVIYTVPKEVKKYEAALPGTHVVACVYKGIALTRQCIVGECDERKLVMVDDDLSFHMRRTDDPTKFRPASSYDVKQMFADIENSLDSYAHASVIARSGGNRVTSDMVCSRPWHVFGFNVYKFREAGVTYTKGLVQDDFDITLQLLRKGYPNLVLSNWAVNQNGGHGAAGGANTYRTVASHNASVERLAKLHSPYVRVVERAYSGPGEYATRKECVISWKKAYADANR